ncbi:MAG: helix-turn-helix domain-containing protein [Agromyces sp.]
MPNEFGRLLTVADVADVLNLSIEEVHELIATGELPAIRLSTGLWRVETEVLRGYIEGKYEEERRSQLWAQAEFSDIPEITGNRNSRTLRATKLNPSNL